VPKKKKERVNRESPDIKKERVEALKSTVPEAFVEGKVDCDKLKEALGDFAEDRPERYTFSWAGKSDAVRILQTPSRATLKPCPEESLDWDNTNNLFIEGDNLEVLKLLYKSYFGRVKMIYIDPPYNTGNDFIYPDNYTDPLDTYLKITGQKDQEGNLLTSNPETSGRYHSTWLTMMYPRLFLARQLLSDDGLIFVSIDEHEVYNLRCIMNEIFGEEAFIAEYIWKARAGKGGTLKNVSFQHEYIICYSKSTEIQLKLEERIQKGGTFEDEKGKYRRERLRQWGIADRREDRPKMYYPIVAPDGTEVYPIRDDGTGGRWRCGESTANELVKAGDLDFDYDGKRWHVFVKIREGKATYSPYGTILEGVGTTADGTKLLKDLFNSKIMEFPKPPDLIKFLTELAVWDKPDSIVLDFFAGSCSTAEAVLDINKSGNSEQRFIMVQLQEPVNDETEAGKNALTLGLDTIAEIGKERIRRVVAKIKEENEGTLQTNDEGTPQDSGFRVFKLDESNYRPWTDVPADKIDDYPKTLEAFDDPLLPDWRPEDVIWEVAVKEGLSLSSRIELNELAGHELYTVTDGDTGHVLRICLDEKLDKEFVKELAPGKEDIFICRDIALNDELAANLALQCRLKTI
jgi:adenine-specific DNA-methyltransferase